MYNFYDFSIILLLVMKVYRPIFISVLITYKQVSYHKKWVYCMAQMSLLYGTYPEKLYIFLLISWSSQFSISLHIYFIIYYFFHFLLIDNDELFIVKTEEARVRNWGQRQQDRTRDRRQHRFQPLTNNRANSATMDRAARPLQALLQLLLNLEKDNK